MKLAASVTPKQLFDILLNVALVRPIFIWGPPGIGKSSLVEKFAKDLGLPCVSLLGSQLAPEDLIGVPQIINGKSRFCPPEMIAREEPYCLFLDELNACSHEVQKAFYSLILDRRVGDYTLPAGSIVIGAGNRADDAAIVKPLSSALINRLFHIELRSSTREWLEWAKNADIHPLIIDYITLRPDHLHVKPPKTEEPFSTPRAWHILSDGLKCYTQLDEETLSLLATGTLSPAHAVQFKAFYKQIQNQFGLAKILKGEEKWPAEPQNRDILYFLAHSLRAHLHKELPTNKESVTPTQRELAIKAKALIKDLAVLSLEIAQMCVGSGDDANTLPDWLLVEIVRDLPRLAGK